MISKIQKILLGVFFIFNIVFLSGCATVSHVPISAQKMQSIHSVYIDRNITKPKEMYAFVSGEEFGFGFGAIGGAVAGAVGEHASTSIQKYAEQNNIDIRTILYDQWTGQLRNTSLVALSPTPKTADAILRNDIIMYGLSIPHGFSSDYIPVLGVNAKLIQGDQIIWQNSGRILPFAAGGMPRYKMKQILEDPNVLRKMWGAAAAKIINEMLSDLHLSQKR